ncbi:MAG: heat-inducible transcriptional repressor HrcA [Firmicutes bacterium]|nr:heat-inducible transcriptional repressor HrcA [Bacillota bacterium]
MGKELSERKQKILKAVVDEYIKSATPVSSGEIKDKYFEDISSATIRSELSTLEDMGFLMQPHTSAGRVPAPPAYKFYAERFLPKKNLSKNELMVIDAGFNAKFSEIKAIVKTAAKVISDVTNYASVIVLKNASHVFINEIKLVGLTKNEALVVVITDSGVLKDKVIKLKNATPNFLADAETLINKIFAGKTVEELKNAKRCVERELHEFKELLDNVMQILISYAEPDVITEGGNKVLDYPEASIESAKNFLSVIEDKKALQEIMDYGNGFEFSVKVGKDETGGVDKCAIVTARYTVNGTEIASAGVIGPERMDYSRVKSVLSYVGETIGAIIKETR